MKSIAGRGYLPGNTFLHNLAVPLKVALLLAYVMFVVLANPTALLAIYLLIIGVLLAMRLPFPNKRLLVIALMLLILTNFLPDYAAIGGGILLSFLKIIAFMMLVSLFGMTTQPLDLLWFQRWSSRSSNLRMVIYLVNTMLAALPGVRYDLDRAIEVETLRRGRAVHFHSARSWITILTMLLVRSVTKSRRLAESVMDRGYSPTSGLRPLRVQSLHWLDLLLTVLWITPGLLVLVIVS